MTTGVVSIRMKFNRSPARKNPNMMCDAIRRIVRMSFTSDGSAIAAPARSSLRRTSTGLNQKVEDGDEQ